MASARISQPGTICSSKTLFLLFSVILLLRVPPRAVSSPIAGARQRQRPAPGPGDRHGGGVDLPLPEQSSGADAQSVLRSLKEQFLRTFNLSGLGPPGLPSAGAREDPPEYMVELYNRFANDRTSMPAANIIRSFKNEDSSPSDVGVGGVRRHPLVFNVSVPHHERIAAAELRLYTLVQTDRRLYAGVDRKVTVYEVDSRGGGDNDNVTEARGDAFSAGAERAALVELASRQVYGTDDGWQAFDLTGAVRRWRKSDGGTTRRLVVHVASITDDGDVRAVAEGDGREGDMTIDTSPREKHKPLLIVFSDDQSADRREDKRELKEMIDHELSLIHI